MRAYGNNWLDGLMAEIEVGKGAYVALAWDERDSDEQNRSYDHGISTMKLWFIWENEARAERGEPPTNDTPWGPYFDPVDFLGQLFKSGETPQV